MIMLKCYWFIRKLFKCVKRPCLFLLLIVASSITTFYFAYRVKPYNYPEMNAARKLLETRLYENLMKEQGTVCKMPKLNPWAPEILKFIHKVDKIVCKEVEWVDCILGQCKVKDEILNKMKDIECIYNDIVYVDDDTYFLGNSVKVLDDQPYMLNRSDHVKISCKGTDRWGVGLISNRWGGNKAGFRPVEVPTTVSKEKPLNILLVLFDSTSRNSFMRLMPKSLKYLTEKLNAVIMNSYNIVGDGTAEALIPMLAGHYYMELPDSRNTGNNTRKVDLDPFIFKLLKTNGYRTAYFEDSPRTGTFQYRFNGFSQQPTDHYLRPFFQEESKWWSLITKKNNCIGSVPEHVFLLSLTRQFFILPGKKFCLTFSATLSHDDLSLLNAADDDLLEFLKRFQSWGSNDTLLFVMGDHGTRYAPVRNSFQGRIEERLPFVSVVLPESFKSKRPLAAKYLKDNSEVLTTPYDMHATMLDFLDLKQFRNRYKVPGSKLVRGFSFFEPIPKTRTCADAFIVPHYCACANWYNVSIFDPMYQRAGLILADYINSLTADRRPLCESRSLILIEWVLRMGGVQNNNDDLSNNYYQAKILMSPGIAMYEGSIQYVVKGDYFVLTSAEITRTNGYGDEADCISDIEPRLNLFCYCKNRPFKNSNSDITVTNQSKNITLMTKGGFTQTLKATQVGTTQFH